MVLSMRLSEVLNLSQKPAIRLLMMAKKSGTPASANMPDALQHLGNLSRMRKASLYWTRKVENAFLLKFTQSWQVYKHWQNARNRVTLTLFVQLANLRASMLHLIDRAHLSLSISWSSFKSLHKMWPRYLNLFTTRTGEPLRTNFGILSGPLPALNTIISVFWACFLNAWLSR